MIVATILQLVLIYRRARTSEPFLTWEVVLSTEIVQCLGVIAACVPYLKPFLESLESGMIGNDDLRRRTTLADTTLNLTPIKSERYFTSSRTEGLVCVAHSNFQVTPHDPSTVSDLVLTHGYNYANNATDQFDLGDEERGPADLPNRPHYVRRMTPYESQRSA